MKEALTYDDVLLVPQYSDIEGRKEVDIDSMLDKSLKLLVPIISSPMDTVTEEKMVIAMSYAGGLGIVHRYNTIEEQAGIINALCDKHFCTRAGAAIGATGDYEDRATALYDAGCRLLCIDVAHGHHVFVKRALHKLREVFGDAVHLMAGNVATKEGFEALSDWGADSVRCNIGGGSICSTRTQTGHGVPGLQTIMDCASSDREAKIIADGGIRNSGDMVKAIAAGADFVMIGSLLAGTAESPGEIVRNSMGEEYKLYRGMASFGAQKEWRGKMTSAPEGISTTVSCKGSVKEIVSDLAMGIRSGLSYSGARSISEFQAKAKFVRQTNASQVESTTHILRSK
jgi:IMP dehydrogenase